ncbi:MAG: precorrin-6A reductase [Actinobacteria bacterium]|nr:precorrin-6A reductase [Actinomycetota bacterium]MCG2808121.1 precorrin-6A reductase [Coriobacteriia bacterium]
MSSRLLLIGGTSDSRELARALSGSGIDVLVSTATEYGAEIAAADAPSRSGALDAVGMSQLAIGCVAIVDASHPFACTATQAAHEAAQLAGVPYLRFERAAAVSGDAMICATPEEAARAAAEAAGPGGTVLLTVGSRTLATYTAACRKADVRCVARVLPVLESLAACAEAGLAPADIIAMQGPASAEIDAALLQHLGASVLVTKDSGDAGGVPAKLEAAKRAGAQAIVVARPTGVAPEATGSVADLVAAVLALPGVELQAQPRRITDRGPGRVHIYTGDGKGKTTASVGLAVRAAGAGLRVAFVQFVKGGRESSELASLRRLGVEVTRPATASSGLMRGAVTQADSDAAVMALGAALDALSGAFDLVVLDEACVAARRGLVTPADLASVIRGRAPHVEVVLTGRGAPPELLELADYVTELRLQHHPYERGVHAREGIEY